MAEFRETAVLENDMARECILHGVGAIGRGRRPFARAEIVGRTERGEAGGTASFYYTPLGMLVCVSIGGLEERGVYTMSLTDGDESDGVELKSAIPPLYARGGYAWCSAITGKILPGQIKNKIMVVRQLDSDEGDVIATGLVHTNIDTP